MVVFANLLAICGLLLAIGLSFAIAIITSGLMAKVQGTEFETRLKASAMKDQRQAVAGLWLKRADFGSLLGYHPLNLNLAVRLAAEPNLPADLSHSIRKLRWLGRWRIAGLALFFVCGISHVLLHP